jgi:transposase
VGISEIYFAVNMTSYGYYELTFRDSYLAKVKYMLQSIGIHVNIVSISRYLPMVHVYQSR